jgi:hypothetical protein
MIVKCLWVPWPNTTSQKCKNLYKYEPLSQAVHSGQEKGKKVRVEFLKKNLATKSLHN